MLVKGSEIKYTQETLVSYPGSPSNHSRPACENPYLLNMLWMDKGRHKAAEGKEHLQTRNWLLFQSPLTVPLGLKKHKTGQDEKETQR